jgi:hypothetical protein
MEFMKEFVLFDDQDKYIGQIRAFSPAHALRLAKKFNSNKALQAYEKTPRIKALTDILNQIK